MRGNEFGQCPDHLVMALVTLVGGEPADSEQNFLAAQAMPIEQVVGPRPGSETLADRVRQHADPARVDAGQLQEPAARMAADRGDQGGAPRRPELAWCKRLP